jgi:hypothetical protein
MCILCEYLHTINVKCVTSTLENIEGANKNGPSRETDILGYTPRRKTKQKHNTICVGRRYTETNTYMYNINMT